MSTDQQEGKPVDATIERDGRAALAALTTSPGPPELEAAYDGMIGELRGFLDTLAGAAIDRDHAERLRRQLARMTSGLRDLQVGEPDRLWGHWTHVPGRGQVLLPTYDAPSGPGEFTVPVVFGRFHVGENMAAHGGAVSMLFDDVLGWFQTRGGLPPGRTAYLTTNFRSVTPVGVELTVHGRIERTEGRKRFLTAELTNGDVVCAEAEGLWVELRPGQP